MHLREQSRIGGRNRSKNAKQDDWDEITWIKTLDKKMTWLMDNVDRQISSKTHVWDITEL